MVTINIFNFGIFEIVFKGLKILNDLKGDKLTCTLYNE
jgi:hypothetical protein